MFKGASSPLIFYDKSVKTGFFGSDGFGSVTHNTTPDMNIISEENGVEALNRIVCENKGWDCLQQSHFSFQSPDKCIS